MSLFYVIILFWIIFSILGSIIIASNAPITERTLFLNVLKWKDLNLFGKIIFIIFIIPYTIIEYTVIILKFIFTWHPKSKD